MNNEETRPITVVIPGDLHLTEAGLANHQVAEWVVEQANELIKPDFVQFIGDNVQDATAEQFELFGRLTDRLNCEWFALVGDHDVHADPRAERFRATVGPTWGSFRLRGYRFLCLNTQEAKPVGISNEQLIWFRDQLADAEQSGDRIVIFQHNYPYQIWEDFAGPGMDEWRILTQTARIEALFCGHTHYWQIANDGRNVHVATRSIGDPEGGEAGYLLVCLNGPNLGMVYRTPQDRGPLIVIMEPRDAMLATGASHVVSGEGRIAVRIWSDQTVDTVTARIDQNPEFPLNPRWHGQWLALFDAKSLEKGTHRLSVSATDRNGVRSEQSVSFVVDPTGRYTAVPCVSPVVTATNFC